MKELSNELINTLPTEYVSFAEAGSWEAFVKANFLELELDGESAIICHPKNSAAFCEFVYGTLIESPKTRLAVEQWSVDMGDDIWRANPNYEADQWLENRDLCGCVRVLIEKGIIDAVPIGPKNGPYPVNYYCSNDCLIFSGYKKYLEDRISFPEIDSSADKFMDGYISDICYSCGTLSYLFFDENIETFIQYGWLNGIDLPTLEETIEEILDPDGEEFDEPDEACIHKLKSLVHYMNDRGSELDAESVVADYQQKYEQE